MEISMMFFIFTLLWLFYFSSGAFSDLIHTQRLQKSLKISCSLRYTAVNMAHHYGITKNLVLINLIIFPCLTIFSFSESPRKLVANLAHQTQGIKKAIYQTRPQKSGYLNHLLLNNQEVLSSSHPKTCTQFLMCSLADDNR